MHPESLILLLCMSIISPHFFNLRFENFWPDNSYFIFIAVYSHSQRLLSCSPCTTSVHEEFIPQMLLLVWLFSSAVSCNSWQECGSFREVTCLELQVSWFNFWKRKYRFFGPSSRCFYAKWIIDFSPWLPDILALSSFGAFWMSYGTIFIPGSGVIAAYGTSTELSNALGLYLITWFMFTTMLMYVYHFYPYNSLSFSSLFTLELITRFLQLAQQW